jgi:hypothetical protein
MGLQETWWIIIFISSVEILLLSFLFLFLHLWKHLSNYTNRQLELIHYDNL